MLINTGPYLLVRPNVVASSADRLVVLPTQINVSPGPHVILMNLVWSQWNSTSAKATGNMMGNTTPITVVLSKVVGNVYTVMTWSGPAGGSLQNPNYPVGWLGGKSKSAPETHTPAPVPSPTPTPPVSGSTCAASYPVHNYNDPVQLTCALKRTVTMTDGKVPSGGSCTLVETLVSGHIFTCTITIPATPTWTTFVLVSPDGNSMIPKIPYMHTP